MIVIKPREIHLGNHARLFDGLTMPTNRLANDQPSPRKCLRTRLVQLRALIIARTLALTQRWSERMKITDCTGDLSELDGGG